jgi:hypothetical protein
MAIVKTFARTLLAVLREIGDENAYQRYLTLHHLLPSRTSWRTFSEERQGAKFRKPKCC